MAKLLKFTLVGILLICSKSIFSQDADVIQDIREKYQIITDQRSNDSLTVTSFEYNCPDFPQDGYIHYYFDGPDLKLVAHSYVEGDHSWSEEQYFIWDNKLFFYFSEYGTWRFDTSEPDTNESGEFVGYGAIDEVIEERYYLHDDQLIKCLSKNFVSYSKRNDNPTSSEVPNEDVECDHADFFIESLEELLKFRPQLHELDGKCIWEY